MPSCSVDGPRQGSKSGHMAPILDDFGNATEMEAWICGDAMAVLVEQDLHQVLRRRIPGPLRRTTPSQTRVRADTNPRADVHGDGWSPGVDASQDGPHAPAEWIADQNQQYDSQGDPGVDVVLAQVDVRARAACSQANRVLKSA